MKKNKVFLKDRVETIPNPYFEFEAQTADGSALTAGEFDGLLLRALEYFSSICPAIGPQDLDMNWYESEDSDTRKVIIGVKMFGKGRV